MDALGRVVEWIIWVAIALGWGWILLPGLVARMRQDPQPDFPPVPVDEELGHDGAANAEIVRQAIGAVLPDVAASLVEEQNEVRLTSPVLGPGESVLLSWDDWGPAADSGTFYLYLEGFGGAGAFFECDPELDISEAFWTAVGFLRSGVLRRQGRAWVHVREVGLWQAFADSSPVSDFEPDWVVRPPD